MIPKQRIFLLLVCLALAAISQVKAQNKTEEAVKAEHAGIGLVEDETQKFIHTSHPDAQWFEDAAFGFFIHYGISSVKAINIGWSMMEGLNGKPAQITPNNYWAMAKEFNPQQYDPDKWLKAAKEAGFTYAVFTTRHHSGFAMWPSAYGNFSTKNYMNGRDLLKDYVAACRKNGLKVGFYYSPPDWYFDRDYMNFNRTKNGPVLGPDLTPRPIDKTPEETAKHQEEYAAMIKGQIEELLTNYGKIDLIWFDGRPKVPSPENIISEERIRELQPGIVLNPRLHGKGDYKTYERTLKTDKVSKTWAELCNTWTCCWPHVEGAPFRANGFVLGELAKCRSLGINYLLGVGPTRDGIMIDEIYKNMAVVADWMKINGSSIRGTKPLNENESASVPATMSGSSRYLFAVPPFKEGGSYEEEMLPITDTLVTLKGAGKPVKVKLLADGSELKYEYAGDLLTVHLPANKRTKLVDVVMIELGKNTKR